MSFDLGFSLILAVERKNSRMESVTPTSKGETEQVEQAVAMGVCLFLTWKELRMLKNVS